MHFRNNLFVSVTALVLYEEDFCLHVQRDFMVLMTVLDAHQDVTCRCILTLITTLIQRTVDLDLELMV